MRNNGRLQIVCAVLLLCGVPLPGSAHNNTIIHPDYLVSPATGVISGAVPSLYMEISENWGNDGYYNTIRKGSIDEDSGANVLKHFYNPKNAAQKIPFQTINALDYGRTLFQGAVERYLQGDKETAYYDLGRAVHVLQDMSVPPHLFVDQHLPEALFGNYGLFVGYETWVYDNRVKVISKFAGSAIAQPERRSFANFADELANITYDSVKIQGMLYRNADIPASGQLADMFPTQDNAISPITYLEYVGALGVENKWQIAGVGSYLITSLYPLVDNDWWEVNNGTEGYFYIESPQNAIPRSYKGYDNRTLQKTLAQLWVERDDLINLPINYSAGLMKYFYDLVDMPPYLKKMTLVQNGEPVYVAEWNDLASARTKTSSINKPIVPNAQINIELEFSRPMSAAGVSFSNTTTWPELKGKFFDETHTKWTAYVEGSQVSYISEGMQSLVITGIDNTPAKRALDANPATIAMRDASGNLINYEDDFGATNTYTGGSDKTHLLAFQGTPPVVSINSSAGGVCSGVSGISQNTFAGYAGNDFTFMVNDSTTGVKYFKLAKLSGETLLEETLETPLPYKAWELPALGIGTYVLIAEDGLGNRTSVPFRVETLEIELDKNLLSGTPAATAEGYARLVSARFGVKINSSAGLRSVELRGLEYNGSETPPVEGTLSYADLNGNASYELAHDISGTSASMGGIYKVVVKDLAGNGKTFVVNVSPVSGGLDSYCLTQPTCQSGEYDMWKVMMGVPAEGTVPSNAGVMPGSAILRATPAMEWQYTAVELPFQEAGRHDMGYVDVSVQSDVGGGAIPRVNYYEVAGENACPSGAFYSYNGCGEGSFGCITPIYSRCGVGTPTVNVSIGRYATFTHATENSGQTALPLGMCPGPCFNIADNTCSCTQALNVRGSMLTATAYGISYSTGSETGVIIYSGTNVPVVAAPGLEIVFDQVTDSGGGSAIGYGVFDAAPAGYQRIAEYEVSNSVPFSGMASMKFDYDPSLVNSAQAALAKIFKVVTSGGVTVYEEIATTVDTAAHKIVGRVSGFSRYMAVCPVQTAPNLVSNGTTPSGAPAFTLLSDGTPSVQPVSPLAGEVAGTVRGLLAEGLVPADQLYSVADPADSYSPYGLLSIAYDENVVLSKNISEDSLSLYGFDEAGNAERLDGLAIDPAANTIAGRVYSTKSYYAVLASTTPVPLPPVDNEAPATVATHVTAAYRPNPYMVYTSSSVSIALDAYDMPADTAVAVGVQATYYKVAPDSATISAGLNGDTTQYYSIYTSTLSLTFAEGRHLLVYGSVDNKGLYEPLEMESIYVDLTAPESGFAIEGSSAVVNGMLYAAVSSSFTLSASDPLSNSVVSGIKIIYYLVDKTMTECVSPPTFMDAPGTCDNPIYSGPFMPGPGTHLIYYMAQDNAGNTEAFKSISVNIVPALDLTPPVTQLEFYGTEESENGTYLNAGSTVAISAMDPQGSEGFSSGVAAIYYLVDADVAVSTPLIYTQGFSLSEGTHTINYTSVDNFGNFDAFRSSTVLVDVTPPAAALEVVGSSSEISGVLQINTAASVVLSATDPVSNGVASGVMMRLVLIDVLPDTCQSDPDFTGPVGTCNNPRYMGPFSLAVGTHTVYYSAMDNADNMAEIRAVLFNVSLSTGAFLPIAPSSGPIGVPFTIEGAGFGTYAAGTTVVLLGDATAPLTLWTDTQIKGTIPGALAAGQYPVVVKRGAEVLAEVSPFTVTQPELYSLTPSSGAIGLPFTITGESFGNYVAGFTRVLLGGATMPLTLWTDTKIQGTIPGTLPAGNYELLVERAINGGVVRTSTTAFSLRDMEAYWLAPSSGPIGMPFTITGAGFGNYSAAYTHVLIGDTTAPLNLWADNTIQGTVPGSLVSGQYPVLVERKTSDGGVMQTSPMTFEVVTVDVASMTPVAGPIGLPFTIYGGNFGNYVANYTRVLIGGTTAPLTLWAADKIQGTIPGALGPGEHPVIVERELNGGVVQSQALAFVVSTPTAYDMTPSSGPIGLPFTINGESFGNYVAAYTGVLINGATVPLTLWTDTQIKGTIPGSLAPGQYPVMVGRMTADGGMVGSNALTFEVVSVNVASMTPVAGPIGLPFSIYGAGFGNFSAGYTKVLIGGTTCPLTLWTDTKVQGTIPGGLAAGEYPVVVERTLNGGQVQSVPVAFTVAVPEAYSLSPTSGPIGLPFTIMGANFGNYVANYTRVLIDGAAAPLTLWTDTKIQGTIPGSLVDGDHEVIVERALNGGVVRTSTFTFTAGTPYLGAVSPSTASVIAPFTITGYNFGNYVANYTKVLINGTTTALTLWTDTKIQGKLPFLPAGTYPVQVQRYLNGGLAESATAYINVEEPAIASMTPVSGAVGTAFNLYGSGFGPYDATIAKVFLGGTQCALSLWTDTRITGTVPSGLSYGTHTVVAARGQAISNALEFSIPGGYSPSMMRPGLTPSALEFKLGEVYVYPDPAKGGKVPTFHIEVGTADSVKLKVFTVAGQLAHETTLTGSPQAVGAVYAYEYAWTGRIASGVYYYTVEADRSGKKLKAKGKFAVVR